MRHVLTRWGTTLIVWSYLVTAVTGVLLFYRIHTPPNEVLHIWIGMLMVVAFIPHIMRNWRTFLGYFRKPPMYAALAATAIISAAFAYPAVTQTGDRGGRPDFRAMFAVSDALANAPVSDLAPFLHTDAQGVVARLNRLGLKVAGPDATLSEAA